MPPESQEMSNYFSSIRKETMEALDVANKARAQGFDPEERVDIPIAENMAERVIGLVSACCPQIAGVGIPERIQELEEECGLLDWRVAFKIGEEVAKEKFCKFETKLEAMEVGIRIGFAYLTLGIVAAPLEGFINLELKKRKDGLEYFAIHYAGPVRGAGGTASAVSVILSDYIRVKMGYAPYDPTEQEVSRFVTEITDYHERVTNLQYFPSEEELKFLASHIPVEITGDPTEKIDVSNYKDLPRIHTNKIRGGMCLVLAEGVSQKSPKLWKRLGKWGKEMDLEWDFLSEFLDLQKKIKAKKKTSSKSEDKLPPNYTFIKDLVAGRPVLTHPLRDGGFRLRFGRSRTSGFSATSINPATQSVLNDFIAVGTQLKMERPGKATAITLCDKVEGPIVKLKDQSVIQLNKMIDKKFLKQIEEIIFLGDILISFGDFSENGHKLVPPGYCPEWWIQELEKIEPSKEEIAKKTLIPIEKINSLFNDPLEKILTPKQAFEISKKFNVALHPDFTYYYKSATKEQLIQLIQSLKNIKINTQNDIPTKIIIPLQKNNPDQKRALELFGIPHYLANNEFIIIEKDQAYNFYHTFNLQNINQTLEIIKQNQEKPILEIINKIAKVKIKDKNGTFIGARMGRPEKAKMRKLTGSPHVLFPVGEEGGRLRCFESTLDAQKITGDFPLFFCQTCKKDMIYPRCDFCGEKTRPYYYCRECGTLDKPECKHGKTLRYKRADINIEPYFKNTLKKLSMNAYPDLIKGVRGTSNKDHLMEHLAKGILRAKYDIFVNKDGTTRYDMSEIPITHFKPLEIGTPIEKLKQMGYLTDIHDKPLEREDQILELKPQDVILPSAQDSINESALKVLSRVCKFIDELLVKLYKMPPYYNIKNEMDIVGHLVIGLAPHISAGLIGRIVGFSRSQGCFAHPLYHAGMRRDCFTYETIIPIKKNNTWQLTQIGKLVESLNPKDIVDDFGTKEIKPKGYTTIGLKNNKLQEVKINNFTKHIPNKIIEIKTKLGRTIKTTIDHKHIIIRKTKEKILKGFEVKKGDFLKIPDKAVLKQIKEFKETPLEYTLDQIISIKELPEETSYCLNVENNTIIANGILTRQCDGDECCVMMLMDAFLNFSRQFLPDRRGGRSMDAPLVLTCKLVPSEVDDQAHGLDIVWKYPLEFYEAALEYKNAWDAPVDQIATFLGKERQYEKMGFTHDTKDINQGVLFSAYKTIPSIKEKVAGQMDIAIKLRAVDKEDVAKLIIDRHFIKDIKGNLRKFSKQKFRCVTCNKKFRRPPLIGICDFCGGKIIFTISHGSIIKYLDPSINLATEFNLPDYLVQTLDIIKTRVESIFGKEKEKQLGLNAFG